LLNALFRTSVLDIDYRFRGKPPTRLSSEVEISPRFFFELAEGFLLLVSLQWGYLHNIVYPGGGPFGKPPIEINLRFLEEGSELAKEYPQFETMKSFREHAESVGSANMHFVEMIQEHISVSTKNRKLFVTKRGYIGLSTPGIRKGDMVAVLPGCRTPVILHEEENGYSLAADSFIYGLMNGEAVNEPYEEGGRKLPISTLCIY